MPIPWSYSYLTNFEKCPKMVYFQKVAKIKDGLNDVQHIIDGKAMHTELENWLNAKIKGKQYAYPERAIKIQPYINEIIDKTGIENCKAERKYAFNHGFEEQIDFFKGKGMWMRAVIDLEAEIENIAYLIDYKSGKYNPYASFTNMGQMQLYAVIKFITSPHIEQVNTYLLYAKDGKKVMKIFHRKKFSPLLKMFVERGDKMFFAKDFPAKPSRSSCKWCSFKEEHCEFAHR